MSNALIQASRLLLEPVQEIHAEALFGKLTDERIYQWISLNPPSSLATLTRRFASLEAARAARSDSPLLFSQSPVHLDWAIRCVADGTYVGKLDAELEGAVATNIGYVIFPEYWNRGFATEAVRALAESLETAGVVEQRACVTRGNDASARVLEKSGFRFTRVISDNDLIRGEKYDDLEFVRRAM